MTKRYETKLKENTKHNGMFAPVKTIYPREYKRLKKQEAANSKPFQPRFS